MGKGTFGLVKIATNTLTNEKVAIKILEKSKIKCQADIDRIKREIKILKMMRHPNIIKLYEIIELPKQIYLVTELCEGGELFKYICDKKKLSEAEAKKIYRQLLNVIEYLAKLRIVHRDIKPENILFDNQMNIKIVDFGLSNTWSKGERLKSACGSP